METRKCLDNMGRKENEKVGFFNCHGQGGNQVSDIDDISKSRFCKRITHKYPDTEQNKSNL